MHTRLMTRFIGRRIRLYSTTQPASTSSAPLLLLKIRNDMKAAMKAKDSVRLDVLRGLIAETTNAAKTSNPVTTDSRMLTIIRKRVQSSEEACVEFEQAGRSDLKDKERAQIGVLAEYIQDSNAMSSEEVSKAAQDLLEKMKTEGQKIDKGSVMKALLGPGGALENHVIDKKETAKLVDGMLKGP